MILKERKVPMHLQQLEALLRRLPDNHPKRKNVYEDFARRMAGYKGEQSVDYHLHFLPHHNYVIMHDLRLFDGSHHFQIDTLIMTTRFVLFLEVKNIAGTLTFDSEFHQLIRTFDNKSEGFPDPLLQIYRQQIQLQKIVPPNLPIDSLIIISNPRTIIKNTSADNPISRKIIHSANLIKKINELDTMYNVEVLTTSQFRKLTEKIINSHSPLKSDILSLHSLSVSDLITGVQCPNCLHTPMIRTHKNWTCPQCNVTSTNAHIQAMKDYALLVRTSIANQEIKDFLQLTSSVATRTLLQKLNLPHQGKCKARKYELTFQDT
jgi:Nuclease-related domain